MRQASFSRHFLLAIVFCFLFWFSVDFPFSVFGPSPRSNKSLERDVKAIAYTSFGVRNFTFNYFSNAPVA